MVPIIEIISKLIKAGTPDAENSCFYAIDCPAAKLGTESFAEMEPCVYSLNMTTFEPGQIPGFNDSIIINPDWDTSTSMFLKL
jgi:hypothetical protein